jgi:hypothetical protein
MKKEAVPFRELREYHMTASLITLNGYTVKDRWKEPEIDILLFEPTDRFTYKWYEDIKVLLLRYEGNVRNPHKKIDNLLKSFK